MQSRASNCRVWIAIIFFITAATPHAFCEPAENQTATLKKGDSLYTARLYTQALVQYQALYHTKSYTPAMLLKMAHIQEGLGRLGESLFYLNLYYLATTDPMALKKMEELAEKNRLEGYTESPLTQVIVRLQQYFTPIAGTLSALIVLLTALLYKNRQTRTSSPSLILTLLLLTAALLFVHVNYSRETRHGIITGKQTYLMSGPSAAAKVVAIVGEGHQLQIKGKQDVWIHTSWGDHDVYVREFLVRMVEL